MCTNQMCGSGTEKGTSNVALRIMKGMGVNDAIICITNVARGEPDACVADAASLFAILFHYLPAMTLKNLYKRLEEEYGGIDVDE